MLYKAKNAFVVIGVLYLVGFIILFSFDLFVRFDTWEIVVYPIIAGILELIVELSLFKVKKPRFLIWVDSLGFVPKIVIIFFLLLAITIMAFFLFSLFA